MAKFCFCSLYLSVHGQIFLRKFQKNFRAVSFFGICINAMAKAFPVSYHIAEALFGDDKIFQSFAFQFPAQTGNIYSQCVVVNEAVAFPESCHDRISGNCLAGVFQKDFQNTELIFGKVNIAAVPGQDTAGWIKDSTFVFQYISRSSEGISAAEEIKITGTCEIRRISSHQ